MSGGLISSGVIQQGGLRRVGYFNNISIARATTSASGDTIKITGANGTALSPSNYGSFTLPSTVTAGRSVDLTLTADVTINLTNAHWGWDTTGNISGAILRVLALNDAGTLKFGVAYNGGRTFIATAQADATAANINLPEEVLVNSALGASSPCIEIGYVKCNFDDATNIFSINSAVTDIVVGVSADGVWQPWNPVYTGFSVAPSAGQFRWTSFGRTAFVNFSTGDGTSNATAFTITSAPAKSTSGSYWSGLNFYEDNSVYTYGTGAVNTNASSRTLTVNSITGSSGWTNANLKAANATIVYEMYP